MIVKNFQAKKRFIIVDEIYVGRVIYEIRLQFHNIV